VADFFNRFFKGGNRDQSASATAADSERVPRKSTGLNELVRTLARLDGQSVLDLGPTSPANLSFFTDQGQRTYTEDVLLASRNAEYQKAGENGSSDIDVDRFLAENLTFPNETFDAVLLWDMPDYLHESLVKPVVQRIHAVTKPGALLLAFFHTKDAGVEAPYQRYHIAATDTLELQRIVAPASSRNGSGRQAHFRLQRVFNNRHIENLFSDYRSLKFFLGRDNVREVLIVR
jgi:SAM-dependent methyltransferase